VQEEITAAIENTPAGPAFSNRSPLRFSREDLERCDSDICRRLLAEGVRAGCCVPLLTRERVLAPSMSPASAILPSARKTWIC